jgi:hypothetical protein
MRPPLLASTWARRKGGDGLGFARGGGALLDFVLDGQVHGAETLVDGDHEVALAPVAVFGSPLVDGRGADAVAPAQDAGGLGRAGDPGADIGDDAGIRVDLQLGSPPLVRLRGRAGARSGRHILRRRT